MLEDYFRQLGTVHWNRDRFFVMLPGKPSAALRCIYPSRQVTLHDARWIEVWLGEDCLDVILRAQDDVTHAMGLGLATLAARVWNGRLEYG